MSTTTTTARPAHAAAAVAGDGGAAHVATSLAARISAWGPRRFGDAPVDASEPALVDEGLRRLALWARTVEEPHPFGADFAALLAPDVAIDRAAVERFVRGIQVAPSSLDRSVLRPALALDELRLRAPGRLPALADPYEPFIRLLERGGDLRFIKGHLVLRASGPAWMLGLVDWAAYAALPPLPLDDASLDAFAHGRSLDPWPRRYVDFSDPVRVLDVATNELLPVERPATATRAPTEPGTAAGTAAPPRRLTRARRVPLVDRGPLDRREGVALLADAQAPSSSGHTATFVVEADATARAGQVDVRLVAFVYVFAGASGLTPDDAVHVRVVNRHPDLATTSPGLTATATVTGLAPSANAASPPAPLTLVGGAVNPLHVEVWLATSAVPGARTLRARLLDLTIDVATAPP